MNRRLVSIVAAVAGSVLGYLLVKGRLRALHPVTIRVREENGRFRSETTPYRVSRRRSEPIKWDIEPDGVLESDATVEVIFDADDSPVTRTRPRARREIHGLRIRDSIRDHAEKGRVYHYEVWYVSPRDRYLMEDPEIQIEHT